MKQVHFQLRKAGYCEAWQHHAIKGAPKEVIRFYATFAHLQHPDHGHVLFDTGYTQRFYPATRSFPFKLYAKITKVFIEAGEEAHHQLRAAGTPPEDIRYIIVSHFHADHIGGLRDFPNAQFICTKNAFEDVRYRKGWAALRRGFIPSLLPEDFTKRVALIDWDQASIQDEILGPVHDLFGDGSILLCALEGHAKGQLGALLETPQGKVFLIADAAWLKPNYEHLRLPHPVVKLFFDSWQHFQDSLQKVHHYHIQHPDTIMLPCHSQEAFDYTNRNT